MSAAKVVQMAVEPYYTPEQIAEILHIHKDTARKTFRQVKGVLVLKNGKLKKHALIRIPHSVLDRYIRENQVA